MTFYEFAGNHPVLMFFFATFLVQLIVKLAAMVTAIIIAFRE